jgi:hypothetical protein
MKGGYENMVYAIAYSDKNGKDFCEKYPWLLDDFSSEYETKERADQLIKEGYKNVIPFRFEGKRKKNEEFTWEYVKEHQI